MLEGKTDRLAARWSDPSLVHTLIMGVRPPIHGVVEEAEEKNMDY